MVVLLPTASTPSQARRPGSARSATCSGPGPGTVVEPPQLDEILMPSDAPFRVADTAALGWDEADVYAP